MANEPDEVENPRFHDLILHPDDIENLPSALRKQVERNMYAWEIQTKFVSRKARDWFRLQVPNIYEIVPDPDDCHSYKWDKWAERGCLLLRLGFEDHDRDFFDAVRLKFEDLNPVGFKIVYRAWATLFHFDPTKVDATTAKVITKLKYPKQFALGTKLD
jgi:hypothetical protein